MAKREYTQTVKPVSRIAEKIFGWLALISLLAVAVFILFISFTASDNPEVVQTIESTAEQMIQSEGLENITPEEFTNAMLTVINQLWMAALYLVLPFILGLFGLLTMRRRILAGFLLLFAGVLSAPLVFGVLTGLIPLFFIIAAILLFVRKDMIVRGDDLDSKEVKKMRKENDKIEKEREREFERARQLEREREFEQNSTQSKADDEWEDDLNDEKASDIESTRKFTRIDEDEINNYESSKSDTDYEYNRKDNNSDATSERRSNVDRRNSDY
ncbi:DUF4064 domain-containing protein [Corticicoccus populi]|uniref:DUF4064 domain-containing protein n=1 Tax=Corticicoccus populi TaxID=1812821 RepID=A0ABW5WVG0_9STAP